MDASTQAHVDDVVGRTHHVFVVLHHQHTVADVAQVLEGFNQTVVVALVQADAGLVQHIHHAGQARADLAGQADALALTATERLRAAVEAEVVQAHVVQKLQPQANLAHHLGGNIALGTVHRQVLKIGIAFAQRGAAHLKDGACLIALANLHMAGFQAQPRAIARRAVLGAAQPGQIFAYQG